MNFSIVLASRDRPELLTNLIKSINDTTKDLSNVEVLVGIDYDDMTTRKLGDRLSRQYQFAKFHARDRSPMLNKDYLNWLYSNFSKGKYIIVCNDDTVFETPNWDQIIIEKMEDYLTNKPDRIAYGYINDALINRYSLGFCCFPLVTREGAEALGFAVPPEYPAWSADVALWKIYWASNRVCDLSAVMIKHISYHAGTRDRDNTNVHVQKLSTGYREDPGMIDQHINRLKRAIKKVHKKEPATLLEKVRNKYDEVVEYYINAHYDAKLDPIWSNNMSDISQIFKSSKTAEELIERIDQTFMYAINFPPENAQNTGVWRSGSDAPHIREKQIDWLLKKQKSVGLDIFELPEHIQESQNVYSRNKVMRNGRILTGNFLRTLSIADRVFKVIGKEKIQNILELGAGCGHQARTLSLFLPNSKYTIVDLPETLIFSYTFISLNFPQKKILFVTAEEDMDKMDEYDFVFIPVVFADRLAGRNYDLFINTASMGEMRNDVIHYWMDLIQNKINIKYLFTLNRFLNTVDDGHASFRRNSNECSTSYDHKWTILNWELEPIYTRCPWIDTLHSRYVEIIASRGNDLKPEELRPRSIELLHEAMSEDWFRLRGMYSDGMMQYRANILVNDMTMEGPLFKLWESIRLDQNRSNVSTMIEYLNRLIVKHPFEERYYYEDLLRRL